jgi:hypothetical protein
MDKGRRTNNSAETSDDVMDEQTVVQLVYRPQPADTRVGLRVRRRRQRSRTHGDLGGSRGTALSPWSSNAAART